MVKKAKCRHFKAEKPNDLSDFIGNLSEISEKTLEKNEKNERFLLPIYNPELNSDKYLTAKIEVSEDQLEVFIRDWIRCYNGMTNLAIENSLLYDAIREPEMLGFYDFVLKKVMDINVRDVSEENFNRFISGMRDVFMKKNLLMLNSIVTPAVYGRFLGKSEGTIRRWMANGIQDAIEQKRIELSERKFAKKRRNDNRERPTLDVVSICGVNFVMVRDEELMLFNRFLMEGGLRDVGFDADASEKRRKLFEVYQMVYDKIPAVKARSSIDLWCESERISPEPSERNRLTSLYSKGLHDIYMRWCENERLEVASEKMFFRKLSEMGFKRFNNKQRGYWVYQEDAGGNE